MIRAQEPDVCRRGRYTKAEACRKLGEKDKPITVQTSSASGDTVNNNP